MRSTVVIKYGGAAMQTETLMRNTMEEIVGLTQLGIQPVIVHGGGPEVSAMCARLGIVPRFVEGLRITDSQTIEVAQMVLVGKINKGLVSYIHSAQGKAVGFSGHDGNLLVASHYLSPSGEDLGFVGEVSQVNPDLLHIAIKGGFIPVIAPIATSIQGISYNVNADTAAVHIAIALRADHLIFLSDTPGVCTDPKDPSTALRTMNAEQIRNALQNGLASGGMIPKLQSSLLALQKGVGEVDILDGRVSQNLSLHLREKLSFGTVLKL